MTLTHGAGLVALPLTHSSLVRTRLAGGQDRGRIRRLECTCFGWERLLFGLWPRVGQPQVTTWITEVNGESVGYLISYDRELDGRHVWYVGGVGVMPKYRCFGLGTQLMNEVFTAHPSLWLHVRAGNRAALNLYEKLGMRQLRRLARFYTNGEDAVVMVTPDLAR